MYDYAFELPNNIRLKILGNEEFQENFKIERRYSLISSLCFNNKKLKKAIKVLLYLTPLINLNMACKGLY